MNKIILLAFMLLPSILAFGQNDMGMAPVRYERGYIYLKDGSIIKGKYVFSSSLEKVRVISGKNTWIFDAGEVEKITMNRPPRTFEDEVTAESAAPRANVATVANPKWFNLTELGVLAGNRDNSQTAPMTFGTSFNRTIRKNLSAGAGFGTEFLKETYVPLTLNVMYRLRDARFTPFAMIQGGYQVPVEESRTLYNKVVPTDIYPAMYWQGRPVYNTKMKARGGFLVNPSFGIMKQYGPGFGMSLAFGYRFHRLHYTAEDDYRLDIDYNRLTVKLGFIFN